MSNRKKICVVTGTRAEYGLLYWLMKELQGDSDIELQLIVTGMHLSPEFGLTWRNIEKDGFVIHERVEMLLSSDTPVGIAQSVGLGVIGFSSALDRLKPDCVVILGDRYEMLAAAQAAYILRVPIAHIGGGETTEGAFDEGIRHAITKFATLHFSSCAPYAKRIVQMGEHPDTVFCVGSTGLDAIAKTRLLDRETLEAALDFSFKEINFLVTYHPATLGEDARTTFSNILAALDAFPETGVIITYPNSDTDGRILIEMIQSYVAANSDRCKAFTSLGQLRYLSAMAQVDVVIGNSSSGIIETPAFKKATVNIGIRQKGRLRSDSVLDCGATKEEIKEGITKALSKAFQEKVLTAQNPYGLGNASAEIHRILKENLLAVAPPKKFYDNVCAERSRDGKK